jgi:hypothetical protein
MNANIDRNTVFMSIILSSCLMLSLLLYLLLSGEMNPAPDEFLKNPDVWSGFDQIEVMVEVA